MFQKEFKLKTISEWNWQVFNEKLGNKVSFGVISGQSMSGKSTVAKHLENSLGYNVIDMNRIAEQVKAKMGTEEEPFEGEVPLPKVEEEIARQIEVSKGEKTKFVFDSFTHKTADDFVSFINKFGTPEFVLFLSSDEKSIKDRWCKKNEAEEFPEDQQEWLTASSKESKERKTALTSQYELSSGRV